MKDPFNKSLICLFTLILSFSTLTAKTQKDETRDNLLSTGEKQKLVLNNFKSLNREDLLPEISGILKSKSTDEETIALITAVYLSYGPELERYLPHFIDDYEWILENTNNEDTIIPAINQFRDGKEKRMIYALAELAKNRNAKVRQAVFQALASFQDDRVLPYILELGFSEKPIERYYYLEAARLIQDERITLHIPKLLNDPSPAIRSEAIAAIEQLNLKDKIENVVTMATKDTNYEVRKTAVVAMKNLKLSGRSNVLQKTLNDSHNEVREVTLDAVIAFKDGYFATNISKAMEKESYSYLRLKMIESLLFLKNHGGGSGLAIALKEDKEDEVRTRAAFAIGRLRANTAIPQLISSLSKDSVVQVKVEITRSLGFLKEKSAVPMMLGKLQEKEPNLLKSEVLAALDTIDDPKVMPVLFDFIETDSNEKPIKDGMKSLLRGMLYRYHGSKLSAQGDLLGKS